MKQGSFSQENKVLFLVFALGLLGCLAGIFFLEQNATAQNLAIIQVGQETWKEVSLAETPSGTEWLLTGDLGMFNRIVVEEGQIAIVEANCPDQICVLRGFQDGSGGAVVCLPHQVLIRFTGKDYDEISG